MNEKYKPVKYGQYLQLEKLLDSQHEKSNLLGQPAHEEMLFIIVHQIYELWFKQILHEIDSIAKIFTKLPVEESSIAIAVSRISRVIDIQKLLLEQVKVIETMTPLDFLEFRNLLIPASGFESFQFRMIESKLGLLDESRLTYNSKHYSIVFTDTEQSILKDIDSKPSLFELLQSWLERMPFVNSGEFNFVNNYINAVNSMSLVEIEELDKSELSDQTSLAIRKKMIGDGATYIINSLDENYHKQQQESGIIRLSHKALISALMIYLYRDEPILRNPYNLLDKIVEMDENFTMWRYRHAQMVMRMLGKKMGTGGSIGHDYLKATAEKHQIFKDFHNISTLLIPRKYIPQLPEKLKKSMDFNYSFV